MADLPITSLPANTALTGAELIPAVQGGVTGKSLISAVGTYVRGLFTTTPATIAEGGTNAATASAARTSLGLVIGTNVQAWDADLDTLAANGAPGATGLALLLATTAAAGRTTLGTIPEAPTTGAPYLRNNSAWQRTFVSTGYVSGNWYPADYGLSMAAGGTMSANVIYFAPLVIYQDVTITALMAEVSTLVAASNIQLAIYAMDPTTKLPIGAALTSTASMSAATATQVSSTLGAALALPAGQYWAAVNCDTAGIALRALATGQSWAASYAGSATMSHVLSANPGRLYWTLAQTFNTWPTVVTVTEAVANTFAFVSGYKAQ